MAEDLEVGVKLVPDEEALQDIQNQEFSVGGDGAGISDQAELDEERNERLQRVNRGVSRVASKLGILTAIAAAVALLAKTVGEIFDISFSDVRDALSQVITDLADSLAQFVSNIPTGLAGNLLGEQTANRAQGAALGGGAFGLFGALAGATFGDQGNEPQTSGTNNQGNGVNVFTSRDALVGDSTQQELQSKNVDKFVLEGGS